MVSPDQGIPPPKTSHNFTLNNVVCTSNFTTMRKNKTREIWDEMGDPMEIERKNVL